MNERIKLLRKTLHLSQEEFGTALGISGPSISKIESGINNPSESTLKLICSTYHVYYRWLTTGEGQMLEDDARARIERIIQKVAPDASDFFKAQVLAYGALMSDESWEIFKSIVEQVRDAKRE
jgi:transcriptional regulator with XRE-family HTH domain